MDKMGYWSNAWRKKHALRKIELGERIRHRREMLNLTQEKLAEQIGLSRTSVFNIESGRQAPPICSLQELLAALDMTAGKLLNNLDEH